MDDSNPLATLPLVHLNLRHRSEQARHTLISAEALAADNADPQLRAACAEMESLFINYLLKEMRATINKSGFISGGRAEELYTSMLDVELSKKISVAGGIGLASLLLKQLGGQGFKNEGSNSK